MPKTIVIQESTPINTSLETLWKIAADDFAHIDRWDANVKSSRPLGNPRLGAKVGGRICNQYGGRKTVEELVKFDDDAKSFTYKITEGLPGFVVSAHNTWNLENSGVEATILTMKISMQVKGILGTLMSGPMKSQMSKVLRNAQNELKHYAETGRPHSRKAKKIGN